MVRSSSVVVVCTLYVHLVTAQSKPDWFKRLPNENLDGVPVDILRNEKHFAKVKDFFLSINGKSGHLPAVQKEARRRQVVT